MNEDVLYDDGKVRLDDDGITLRRYYFPTLTAKHIRYRDIRSVETRTMGWMTGRGRLWGTTDPRLWLPLDGDRPGKETLIVLDLGRIVRPAFTPEQPDRVVALIERHRT
jgi:hypothetical protein